jgi:hypothetical protein
MPDSQVKMLFQEVYPTISLKNLANLSIKIKKEEENFSWIERREKNSIPLNRGSVIRI